MRKLLLAVFLFTTASAIAQEKSDFPTNGYRGSGFVYMATNGDDFDTYSFGSTHGYQINPKWFIGGGMQLNYGSLFYKQEDHIFVSITEYANIRLDMIKKRISPYLNLKTGYTLGDIEGVLVVPEVGVRFRHFNVGIGVECQSHEAVYGLNIKQNDEDEFSELFMIRLAYDFCGRKK
ncbi:MAG: hypothetical protein IKI25_08560 [Bacteroidales bacterium]|nr:hypothetical protein [Salinivirgaceae bacterium]MBR7035789.1 hypothetical protein [Bacteroidales bacterium]